MNKSRLNIIFYVAALIFLGIAIFTMYTTYQSIALYQTNYSTSLSVVDILNTYFNNCARYFAYAIICYGVGIISNQATLICSFLATHFIDDSQVSDDQEQE